MRPSERMIGIDTEYHLDALGRIDKVYCICATASVASEALGRVFKLWTYKHTDKPLKREYGAANSLKIDSVDASAASDEYAHVLDDIAAFFHIENPIFVCHGFDKAERRALKFLGVDVGKYKFIDTYQMAKQLTFNMNKVEPKTYDSEEEAIAEGSRESAKKSASLSYAALCSRYGLGLVDTQRKDFMRQLCIQDNTSGYESEILDYCADDTKYLIPLYKALASPYMEILSHSYCPLAPKQFSKVVKGDTEGIRKFINEAVGALVTQCYYVNLMGNISDRGLPVSLERVSKVRENAVKYRERLKEEFNKKFPRTYLPDEKTKTLKRCTYNVQYYLYHELKRLGALDSYPRTSTGKLSTSKDTLKDFFKSRPDSFGEQYRQCEKLITVLNKVSGTKDNPLDYITEDGELWYDSLEPYGSKTTRNQPRKRFLFGWHKSFYGLLEPKEGKWLVELDYSSEETFIQAALVRDERYYDIYSSKDIYLSFAVLLGLIPREDFDTLSVDELKHRYKAARNLVKPMILGLTYGMGADKLCKVLGVPEWRATDWLERVKRIIKDTTGYKGCLNNAIRTMRYGYKGVCTPDGAICYVNPRSYKPTTLINYPFQSAGGYILRHLVDRLERSDIRMRLLATIHDAIFFEVDEGDYEAIEAVKKVMVETANFVMRAPKGWTIRVGEAEIIKRGEIWTPEHAFDEQFKQLLEYSEG